MKLCDICEGTEPEIEAYARKHGLGEVSWEGSGDMGHAYVTESNTILKTTRDKTELKFASMIAGKKLDNVVDIYDVEGNVIHMEFLDTSGIEDLYAEAMTYIEYGDITEVDPDDHADMSPEVERFIEDIRFGAYQLKKHGINNLDVKDNNIGRKPNGDYAIFDMSDAKWNGRGW